MDFMNWVIPVVIKWYVVTMEAATDAMIIVIVASPVTLMHVSIS